MNVLTCEGRALSILLFIISLSGVSSKGGSRGGGGARFSSYRSSSYRSYVSSYSYRSSTGGGGGETSVFGIVMLIVVSAVIIGLLLAFLGYVIKNRKKFDEPEAEQKPTRGKSGANSASFAADKAAQLQPLCQPSAELGENPVDPNLSSFAMPTGPARDAPPMQPDAPGLADYSIYPGQGGPNETSQMPPPPSYSSVAAI